MSKKRLKYGSCRQCEYYIAASKPNKGKGNFFKILVSVVVLHGMICVSMSYILAWLERTQVVEGVSSTIIAEMIAPIFVYGFTKTIENIFEKNRLAFSEPINPCENEENIEVAPVQLEREE